MRWAVVQPELVAVDDDELLPRRRIADVLSDAPRAGVPATVSAEHSVQIITPACSPLKLVAPETSEHRA